MIKFNTVAVVAATAAACLAASGASAADNLPERDGGVKANANYACARHGEGFFAIPGTDTCIQLGGLARADLNVAGPQRDSGADRYGTVVTGRLSADARTPTEWGTLRTFVRFEMSSLSGASFSGDRLRQGAAFGASGVDTAGKAQRGVELDRAFIQFGSLTAGRSNSFFDFYAHDLENIGATPVSDPPPVDLLAWTFGLGHGASLTVSAENPIARRTPIAFSGVLGPDGVYQGGDWSKGLTPAALVPAGTNPDGTPRYAWLNVAQPVTMPDIVAAFRIDQPWGAFQLSGVLRRIGVSGLVGGPVEGAARPKAQFGGAVQAGVKVNLPMITDGDNVLLQGAWGRGALSYTGAATAMGFDVLTGSPSGKIEAIGAEGYVDPAGRLRLSDSWSAVVAYQHYWRPTVAQSVFAGISRINYGKGVTAGMGEPEGFSGRLPDNETRAIGTRLDWMPVKDLTVSGEVAWTEVKNRRARADSVAFKSGSDSSWAGKLRIERAF